MTDQPTPTPLKLTDEVIGLIAYSLAMVEGREDSVAIEAAIRTLRDRARAVVEQSNYIGMWTAECESTVVPSPAIDALREVLP